MQKLQNLGYDLTLEDDSNMFGFLGIEFNCTGDTIRLTQKGLIIGYLVGILKIMSYSNHGGAPS